MASWALVSRQGVLLAAVVTAAATSHFYWVFEVKGV